MRRNNPKLRQAANSYVANIHNKYYNDCVIWTDGSRDYHSPVYKAGCAMVASHQSTIKYFASLKLQTKSIAIAELCGILHSLIWLHKTQPPLQQNIRFLADNQYIIDAINDKCKSNINHLTYVNKIKQYKLSLTHRHNISFDWIPGTLSIASTAKPTN